MPWSLSNGIAVSRSLWASAAHDIKTLASPLLEGFHRAHPLSDTEVSLLWDAIILRLLITILLSDVKLELAAGQDPDIVEDRTEAYEMLVRFRDLDRTVTINQLRSICGYGQGIENGLT